MYSIFKLFLAIIVAFRRELFHVIFYIKFSGIYTSNLWIQGLQACQNCYIHVSHYVLKLVFSETSEWHERKKQNKHSIKFFTRSKSRVGFIWAMTHGVSVTQSKRSFVGDNQPTSLAHRFQTWASRTLHPQLWRLN